MQLNIDIESTLATALAEALNPEKIAEHLQSVVDKAVLSAINEATSYSSPFRKMLEQQLQAAMPGGIEGIGRFADLVGKIVNNTVADCQNQVLRNKLESNVREAIKFTEPTITLSDLVKAFFEKFSEDEHLRECSSYPTFIFERNEHHLLTEYWELYVDRDEDVDATECEYRLSFNGKGQCSSIKVHSNDISKGLFIGKNYGIEAMLLGIYTNGTTVTVDTEDFDRMYYPGHD